MQQSFIEIDVRDDLALKKEPFDKIMGAVKQLQDGQSLILPCAIQSCAPTQSIGT